MTTKLCGARYRHNRAITCGKQPGHLNVDPLHKMAPDASASCEWFDFDTADREPLTVEGLCRAQLPGVRTVEDVAADPRPLGWLFSSARLAGVSSAKPSAAVFDEFPEGGGL